MRGSNHYRMAEDLLNKAGAGVDDGPGRAVYLTPEQRAELTAMAQAHATLALAWASWRGNHGDNDWSPRT